MSTKSRRAKLMRLRRKTSALPYDVIVDSVLCPRKGIVPEIVLILIKYWQQVMLFSQDGRIVLLVATEPRNPNVRFDIDLTNRSQSSEILRVRQIECRLHLDDTHRLLL